MPDKKINWNGPQPAPSFSPTCCGQIFHKIRKTGRNVAGTNKKSSHAENRARDFHLDATDPSQRALGDRSFDAIIAKADKIGVDKVIWNRQIWSVRKQVAGKRKFAGKNPIPTTCTSSSPAEAANCSRWTRF